MWAAHFGHADIVVELLKVGDSFGDKKVNGDSPLVWAARNGHAQVVWELTQAG